jgi:anti-sigma regulatory factor (Ser/Thr protein kinase)
VLKPQSELIRRYIIDNVDDHPRDIARMTCERFGITRQAVNRHLRTLIDDGILTKKGKTKEAEYALTSAEHIRTFNLSESREEDVVWREFVGPILSDVPDNIIRICNYGFTEIFNNAIDHSEGTGALVTVTVTAKKITIMVSDNGVGIFSKLKDRFKLDDLRQAVLELAKGKLTTDPANHSGQGIFFSSRMFDEFSITADGLFFIHEKDNGEDSDWLIETTAKRNPGTDVFMHIFQNSERTAKEVFDKYTDIEDDYAFSKTHVPLSLARYGNELLVSRSQAKRVLSRFNRFEEVLLDFKGVESIGQAFADEIFRVFANGNPGIKIVTINSSPQIEQMIRRAQSDRNLPSSPDNSS